jgi:UDP-glucose 4-epimerase
VQKTVELLNVCARSNTSVVFASSAAIYGNANVGTGIAECSEKLPLSPYALQKLQVEQIGDLFASLYGLKFTALRFFNIYGSGQDGESAYSTVIASWVERIKSKQPLRLDGDGDQTRDYINIDDVVDAIFLSLGANAGKFNIASGVATSNNDILSILREYAEFSVENAPKRVGDIKFSMANVEKASTELKFTEKISLVDGIKELLL